ncbi:MAG: hypothetical protein JWR50_3163 [Mucilaginibacter sp.]|nr:hypothetical protein [Mucilaginibacter sp.]
MKKILPYATIVAIAGCSNPSAIKNTTTVKNTVTDKYIFTTIKDKFNESKNIFEPAAKVDTMLSANDTTAYLDAIKKWYDLKIDERKNVLSPSKSFTVVDKNGVDLTAKLPASLIAGINNQVESLPDVKKLIEDTKRDSLATP